MAFSIDEKGVIHMTVPSSLIPGVVELPPYHLSHPPVQRASVSVLKACALAGVSRRTIYNWMASKKVEYIRTAGGSRRIYVDTLFKVA